jgi:hypothetical protein
LSENDRARRVLAANFDHSTVAVANLESLLTNVRPSRAAIDIEA